MLVEWASVPLHEAVYPSEFWTSWNCFFFNFYSFLEQFFFIPDLAPAASFDDFAGSRRVSELRRWQQLTQSNWTRPWPTMVSGWKYGDEHIPSLKPTVRTRKWAGPQRETIVFQPSIFRCHVSFRDGTQQKWYVQMIETWRLQLGDKSIYRCSFRIVKNTWVPSSCSCIPTSLGYL